MRRCDNVGGLGDDVTCHMFWLLSRPFFLFTLFFSPPARAGGRILTIYTSYDVIPPKEVPFGGGDDIAPHLGSQMPQKPQFLGRE